MNKNNIGVVLGSVGVLLGAASLVILLTQTSPNISNNQKAVDELSETVRAVELQDGFSVEGAVNKGGWQAVFLSDDQVYYGKLSDGEPGQLKLENIYYLQTQEAPAGSGLGPEISLAKLGNEIHGPEDVMHISRDQIEFWENLKLDSEIVRAIEDYEANQQ